MASRRRPKKRKTPRRPRRAFHVSIRSNWAPDDWTAGTTATINTSASRGPGKAVVKRILRDALRRGLVPGLPRVVDELCERRLSIDQAIELLRRA